MNTIKVLIVEDNPEESGNLADLLESRGYTVADTAGSFEEALKLFYETEIDLLIIDIFLQGAPDGIRFAEALNVVPDARRPFVFLTSSRDRSVFEQARLTQPYSYLLKPFNDLELEYALEMAVEQFYGQEISEESPAIAVNDALFIRKGGSMKKVQMQDILYVEVEARYCTLFTRDERFVVQISLKRLQEQLPAEMFVQTHRSFLVNKFAISEIILSEGSVILEGGHSVPLGEKYRDITEKIRIL